MSPFIGAEKWPESEMSPVQLQPEPVTTLAIFLKSFQQGSYGTAKNILSAV